MSHGEMNGSNTFTTLACVCTCCVFPAGQSTGRRPKSAASCPPVLLATAQHITGVLLCSCVGVLVCWCVVVLLCCSGERFSSALPAERLSKCWLN